MHLPAAEELQSPAVEEAAARTRDAIDAVMPLLNAGHDVLFMSNMTI